METARNWLHNHVWRRHPAELPVPHLPVDASNHQVCCAVLDRQRAVAGQYNVPDGPCEAVQKHGAAAPSPRHVCLPCRHCGHASSGLLDERVWGLHSGAHPAHHSVPGVCVVLCDLHPGRTRVSQTHGVQGLRGLPAFTRGVHHVQAQLSRRWWQRRRSTSSARTLTAPFLLGLHVAMCVWCTVNASERPPRPCISSTLQLALSAGLAAPPVCAFDSGWLSYCVL